MVMAVVAFTAKTVGVRVPYWGEAEVLFDAARLRAHLPLFVDPLQGAHEAGEPPSRWYVTYPPLWAFFLSLTPSSSALVVGRVVSSFAWLGALFGLALPNRRLTAFACAAYVGGSWVLANFATVARPDSVACALAAWGLGRALAKGRIDWLSAVLLSLAPWVKPTLLGLPAGAFLGDLVARRSGKPIAVACAVTVSLVIVFELASHGMLFVGLARSNAQPLSFDAWLEHVPSRLPFFLPVFALALVAALRARVPLATGALVGSISWTLVALAKIGSASNYWMEPCIASVAVIAFAPPTSFEVMKGPLWQAALSLVAVLYAGVATVRASWSNPYAEEAAFVRTLPALCHGVVASDEAGIELATNGRILLPTYQFSYLVKSGAFPAQVWRDDIRQASCFVEHTGQLPAEVRNGLVFRPIVEHGTYRVFSVASP